MVEVERVLSKYKLNDDALTLRESALDLPLLTTPLVVNSGADVGIRDDILHMYVSREILPDSMCRVCIRDMIFPRRITFADNQFVHAKNKPKIHTLYKKIADELTPAFIETRALAVYNLDRPYVHMLLVMRCVLQKFVIDLTKYANDKSYGDISGGCVSYKPTRFRYTDFEQTQKTLLGHIENMCTYAFRLLDMVGGNSINVQPVNIDHISPPEIVVVGKYTEPQSIAETIKMIESFFINNRENFREIERYYINKAVQVRTVITLIIDIHYVVFHEKNAFVSCLL